MPRVALAEKKEKRALVLPPVRVSSSERDQIKARALAAGLSLSEFQRRASLNLPILAATPRASRGDAGLVRQLAGIGNNLNQLARKAHIHDDVDAARLREVMASLERTIEDLIR